jgi:hypothetical protein
MIQGTALLVQGYAITLIQAILLNIIVSFYAFRVWRRKLKCPEAVSYRHD